ncbi:MAG: hypothetical protein ACHQHN_15160 [Sphingobacteriales bacterium]
MATFSTRTNKSINRGLEYFSKLYNELDIEKYKLEKYKELFMLGSFKAMHDADLAYNEIYHKCAQNAWSKESLLRCLEEEEQLSFKHPESFDNFTYRYHVLKAITEIRLQLQSGNLDHLYL